VQRELTENLCRKCGAKLRYVEGSKKWICDDCQTSFSDIPPPPTLKAKRTEISIVSMLVSIIGVIIFGGIYMGALGLVLAVIGWRRGEKYARQAIVFALMCIGFSLVLMRFWLS